MTREGNQVNEGLWVGGLKGADIDLDGDGNVNANVLERTWILEIRYSERWCWCWC